MFALVLNSEVVQIEPAIFDVSASLEWIDITALVPQPKVGWSFDGATFTPPPPRPLADLKSNKQDDFIAEAVARIAAQVPDWDSLDTIKTVAGLWTSHLVANATPAQIKARNLYLYIRNTVPAKLAAVTTQAALDAIDPSAADPFGDAPWPI